MDIVQKVLRGKCSIYLTVTLLIEGLSDDEILSMVFLLTVQDACV